MSGQVDARGLACPQPVLLTLEKLKGAGSGEVQVLVDTEAARENVGRAASGRGWSVKEQEIEAGTWRLVLNK